MKQILETALSKSTDYLTYRELVASLLSKGKSTGPVQSEALLHYSILNDKRMARLDKTIKLQDQTLEFLETYKQKVTWLVLSEGWCGDAAQVLPVLNKMAEANEGIELKIALRDENEDLMNRFLTNGGKSIPKLILLNDSNEVIDSWGPRPSEATKMVNEYKSQHGALDDEFKRDLQVWYNKNKGKNTQEDLIELLSQN